LSMTSDLTSTIQSTSLSFEGLVLREHGFQEYLDPTCSFLSDDNGASFAHSLVIYFTME
jgi:hypothetical protein